jgi:sugar (pentulose or hexulose) kinase
MTLRGLAVGTHEHGVLIVDRHGDAISLDWQDALLLVRTIVDRCPAHERVRSAAKGQAMPTSTADQQLNMPPVRARRSGGRQL